MAAQRTNEVKAVIFDLDGTLLDTEVLSDKAVFCAIDEFLPQEHREHIQNRYQDRLPWELKKKLLGLRGSEWVPIVIKYSMEHWGASYGNLSEEAQEEKKENDNALIEEIWKRWEHHLNELCLKEVQSCPGATELVQRLSQSNIPMGIATSSRKDSVQKKRKHHEDTMFRHISVIVTGDDPNVIHGKPAPDIYIETAKRMGIPTKNCLVFEDALSGVQSAKDAGCMAVAVPDPRMDKSVFESDADVVLGDMWHFDGNMFGLEITLFQN